MLYKYWSKYYVRKQSYEQDLNKINTAYIQFVGNVAAHITKNIKAHSEAARRTMQEKADRLDMNELQTSQSLINESSVLVRLQAELHHFEAERDEAERTVREEMALSRHFTRLLADEYDGAVETAHADVMKATDPVAAFEHLVRASMLRESHESVWTRINGAMKQ